MDYSGRSQPWWRTHYSTYPVARIPRSVYYNTQRQRNTGYSANLNTGRVHSVNTQNCRNYRVPFRDYVQSRPTVNNIYTGNNSRQRGTQATQSDSCYCSCSACLETRRNRLLSNSRQATNINGHLGIYQYMNVGATPLSLIDRSIMGRNITHIVAHLNNCTYCRRVFVNVLIRLFVRKHVAFVRPTSMDTLDEID